MDQEVARTTITSIVVFAMAWAVYRTFSFMWSVERFIQGIYDQTVENGSDLLEVAESCELHLAKMSRTVRMAANEAPVLETPEELAELKAEARKWLDEASVGQDTNKIISPDDLLL